MRWRFLLFLHLGAYHSNTHYSCPQISCFQIGTNISPQSAKVPNLLYFLPIITFPLCHSETHSVLAYDILIVPTTYPPHVIAVICPGGGVWDGQLPLYVRPI